MRGSVVTDELNSTSDQPEPGGPVAASDVSPEAVASPQPPEAEFGAPKEKEDATPEDVSQEDATPPEASAATEEDPPTGSEEGPADDAETTPADEPLVVDRGPIEEVLEDAEEDALKKDWYILKVQSNRESSIRDALERRVKIAGMDEYFGEIIVPTEDVAEFKGGKKRVVKRKLYPGYIVVHMVIFDDTWFLVRETPGIGDFTGSAGKPTPLLPHEVDRIVKASKPEEAGGEAVKTAIPFKHGDRVRIKEGMFENFEGDVEEIDEANGRVTVMINIFGRSTPVELEHWQVESI